MNNRSDMSSKKEIVICIQDVRISFGDHHVLKGFSLDLYDGENLVIMGKSGCGKSIMIKCLIGLQKVDSGSINIMGYEITDLEKEQLDELRTEIGFLFQGSALYDSMSVRENLDFPLRRHTNKFGTLKNTDHLIIEALTNVGLEDTIDLMPNELSGGMKRRVALARTLIHKPKIILYDEPTTGLDPITSKEIVQLIQSIQKKYKTSSIIITHDVDCARAISNRMILLIDGIAYITGTFEELSQSNDPKVKAFFK